MGDREQKVSLGFGTASLCHKYREKIKSAQSVQPKYKLNLNSV